MEIIPTASSRIRCQRVSVGRWVTCHSGSQQPPTRSRSGLMRTSRSGSSSTPMTTGCAPSSTRSSTTSTPVADGTAAPGVQDRGRDRAVDGATPGCDDRTREGPRSDPPRVSALPPSHLSRQPTERGDRRKEPGCHGPPRRDDRSCRTWPRQTWPPPGPSTTRCDAVVAGLQSPAPRQLTPRCSRAGGGPRGGRSGWCRVGSRRVTRCRSVRKRRVRHP